MRRAFREPSDGREPDRSRRALCIAALALLASCARRSDEDSPEAVVREFIDRMQRVHGDVERARAAYELLAAADRAKLAERANRASAAMGRAVQPEEMLAPSRFYLDFQPRSWSTEQGANWAVVTAEGASPGERRQIRCVREQDRWKVVIDMPELPPIEQRPAPR